MLKRTSLLFAATLALGVSVQAQAQSSTITGAGATFPYPVYSQWADDYQDESGVGLNYQAIGSGGGIRQITAGTVTFGASDAPLSAEQQERDGLVQFPMIMGGVVPVINVDIPAGELKLDGETLAAIYLGEIDRWNDERIAALNPDIELPDTRITPVYRSDGSGTNFLFTHYLSQVSEAFSNTVGEGNSVAWPSGVGAQANGGVAAQVGNVRGAIGYVEYAYAKQNDLNAVQLENSDGQYVAPSAESFAAAAANADWANAPGFALVLTNQPGEQSWPITGVSYILMHKQASNAAASRSALEFFDWAYANGEAAANALDYVSMPDNVVELVKANIWSQIQADGQPVWTGAE
ncbi:phosphate ABC transporter substrate-binding protein PstS [Halotalea alkalilenta]|uniref:phosphate ABC transporter substrate-binding protein PstS n=1 Tax=Halotalea alkalilenta TaxID=376489 RepID=UPI000486287C|nr:phosphate ABC transporter substrate-binding protein PstS [Halotalea alkalilenta]